MKPHEIIRQVTLAAGLIAALALIGVPGPVLAQWGYATTLEAAYNSNPTGIHDAESSSVVTVGGGLDFTTKIISIGYLARYASYARLEELDGYTHRGFVSIGHTILSLSVEAEQRLSGASRLYDYSGIRSNVTSQFMLLGIRWGATAGVRKYDFEELANRNQWSILGAMQMARSFSTGTTLIASVGLGETRYTTGATPDARQPKVQQVNGTVRLAQALSATTGLAGQAQLRRLAGETPADYIIEEEGVSYALLDDPSLYSHESVGVELTQMLFDYRLTVKIGAYLGERDYLTQGIYVDAATYDVSTPRNDVYHSLWLKAAYDLRVTKQNIALQLGAQWVDNASSSYWYTHADSYLSLGIDYNF